MTAALKNLIIFEKVLLILIQHRLFIFFVKVYRFNKMLYPMV